MSRFDELRTWRWLLAAFFLSVVQYARADADLTDHDNAIWALRVKQAADEARLDDQQKDVDRIKNWMAGLAGSAVLAGAGLARRRGRDRIVHTRR